MKFKAMKIFIKICLTVVAFGVATMLLWNHLMPGLFKLPALTLGQAIGLLILSRLFFGGFGVLKDMGHFMARKERQAILENWHSMLPEQRAQCLARIRAHHDKASGVDVDDAKK